MLIILSAKKFISNTLHDKLWKKKGQIKMAPTFLLLFEYCFVSPQIWGEK